MSDDYRCDRCGKTFGKGWTDEEAMDESRRLFGPVPTEDLAVVCGDCFREIMRNGPPRLRNVPAPAGDPDVSSTLTHIAGVRLDIAGRVIQRCSLCGAKLCDSEDSAMPVGPDGEPPTFPTWEVGRLVQVEAGNPTRSSLLPDTDKLPPDSCLDFA